MTEQQAADIIAQLAALQSLADQAVLFQTGIASLLGEIRGLTHLAAGVCLGFMLLRLCGFGLGVRGTEKGGSPC